LAFKKPDFTNHIQSLFHAIASKTLTALKIVVQQEVVFFSSSTKSSRHMEELQKQEAERTSEGKAKEEDLANMFWL